MNTNETRCAEAVVGKDTVNISAAARAAGIARTTFRWRLASQQMAASQAKYEMELAAVNQMLKELKQSHVELSRRVSSLSETLQNKVDKNDLRTAINDVNKTIEYVNSKSPYGR